MAGPLEGIQGVELSLMAAGPWTGTLLAELGAEVLKIESPAGDGTRWTHPTQRGMGTNFISMNLGKRDAILDLKNSTDRAVAHSLIREADIFIQNLSGGVADRLGVGYAELSAINPRLVYCSISGYGPGGPLGHERCGAPYIEAFSGLARLTGAEGSDLEQFRFTGLMDLVTAAVAVEAIIAALLERERTGFGQQIDVSMLEAALELQFTRFSEFLSLGDEPNPQGSESSNLAPDRAFRALDRPIFVTVHDDAGWIALCEALNRPDLADDSRFARNGDRVANRKLLATELAPLFVKKPAIWWLRTLTRHGVAVTVERDFDTLRGSVQVTANDMIGHVVTKWGSTDVGGVPWKFSRTPGFIRPTQLPGADTSWAHSKATEISSGNARTPQSMTSKVGQRGGDSPLQGIRVLELHSSIAGALAGLRLQDLGADVIKIEPPRGDWLRKVEPKMPSGDAAMFVALNRGKKSVRLGKEASINADLIARLISSADVVIEDFQDQTLDGPEFPDVSDLRERARKGESSAIWIELSDFGSSGPLAGARGSELIVQAYAGYTRWIGKFGDESERLGPDVGSCTSGIFAIEAVLAALYWKMKGGCGQLVSLSRLNSLLSLASIHLAAQSDPDFYEGQRVGGEFFEPMAGWKTGGRSIVFQFGGSSGKTGRPGWEEFMIEIGAEWILSDPRFSDDKTGRESTGHGIKSEECKPIYEEIFRTHSDVELIERIRHHGGEAAPFLGYFDLVSDPQLAYLQSIKEVAGFEEKTAGRALAFPAHFSDLDVTLNGGIAHLGADTEVIARDCGISDHDVALLLKS